MSLLEDKAKNSVPLCIEVLKGTNENKIIFCIFTKRLVSINNGLTNKEFLLVEVHPAVKYICSSILPFHEIFGGTDYSNILTNRFTLHIDKKINRASFGPHNSIVLDLNLRGFKFGSYMLNELIKWGAVNFPAYKVSTGTLSLGDAEDEENKTRRNNFYKKFGFKLTPSDPTDGSFSVNALSELIYYNEIVGIEKVQIPITRLNQYPHFNLDLTIEYILEKLEKEKV